MTDLNKIVKAAVSTKNLSIVVTLMSLGFYNYANWKVFSVFFP